MKRIFFSILLMASVHLIYAQSVDLTPEELDQFKVEAKNKIGQFQNCLTIIASKDYSNEEKLYMKGEALKLFIGKGEYYTSNNGQHIVTMEVSSMRGGQTFKRKIIMKDYLTSLARLRYANVQMKFAETIYVSGLYKVGDNKYQGTATFYQYFIGCNGDNCYKDKTQKTVQIFVEKKVDAYGERWVVELGNIQVEETSNF